MRRSRTGARQADAVVRAARGWLGTPYHDQASLKGVGCDCLGLVRGIWREVIGSEPEIAPPYTRDWGETGCEEVLLDAARRHLVEIAPDAAGRGAVLVFRMRARAIAKHAAILVEPARFLHACERLGVVEQPLTAWWRRRVAGAFLFPARRR